MGKDRIPAVVMRGGTSRAVFFHREDLPSDESERHAILLRVLGSPDPYLRQTDGLGGATSSTSKVALIAKSEAPGIDIEYTFGQVSIDRPIVDLAGNCGNISAAVGPYAVDEGMVPATEPITSVRILNTNTGRVIIAAVPVRQGRFNSEGEFSIDGVPGTGARIELRFVEPAGAVTGKLLPTGSARDNLDVPGMGRVAVSIVDAAHLFVFAEMTSFGLSGQESPQHLNDTEDLMEGLEALRAAAGAAIGIAEIPSEVTRRYPTLPRLALVGPPSEYRDTAGRLVDASAQDLLVRAISMGQVHHAYPVTGGLATAVAAGIRGSVVEAAASSIADRVTTIRCGHPAGIMRVGASVRANGGRTEVAWASVSRTARRLMEGSVVIPQTALFGG